MHLIPVKDRERPHEPRQVDVQRDRAGARPGVGDAGPHPFVDEGARERGQFINGGQLIVGELRKGEFQLVRQGNPGVDDSLLELLKRHEQEIEFTPEVARELDLLAVQVEA